MTIVSDDYNDGDNLSFFIFNFNDQVYSNKNFLVYSSNVFHKNLRC